MSEALQKADKLRVVLEAEENLYQRMQNLLRREREALLRLDVEEIEDCVGEKEVLAEEGRLLEDTRSAICGDLGRELGLHSPNPTLTELCAALGADAGELPSLHARLLGLLGAARELIEMNERFAGGSLERVQSTLRLLGGFLPESPIYGPAGETDRQAGASRLFERMA